MSARIFIIATRQKDQLLPNCTGNWGAAFGEIACKTRNIYHWRLKIKALRGDKEILIGVIDYNLAHSNTKHLRKRNAFAFWSRYRTRNCKSAGFERTHCEQKLEEGDTVEMKLNSKKHTLSFIIMVL